MLYLTPLKEQKICKIKKELMVHKTIQFIAFLHDKLFLYLYFMTPWNSQKVWKNNKVKGKPTTADFGPGV